MSKYIQLSKGKHALVDDSVHEWLSQWDWHFSEPGYAVRSEKVGRKRIYMHREVNNTPSGLSTDHINGNKLDNRRSNLRTVSHEGNMNNMRMSKKNTSSFVGVSWSKFAKKWSAYISWCGRRVHIGYFICKEDAVKARNTAQRNKLRELKTYEIA